MSGIQVIEGECTKFLHSHGKISGLVTKENFEFLASAVVITSGTFMGALMFTGFNQTEGGRVGENSANSVSKSLKEMGFNLKRLKTGTPPRLSKKSINFNTLEEQPGDSGVRPFSVFYNDFNFPVLNQISCYITYTNIQVHEIIEENFNLSPMFSGLIEGIGPRYCPSIEDKVKRFKEKDRHQVFLEPEGLDTDWVYVNGVSTSLPANVQEQFIRKINGLESAVFLRHGYAVEYDAVDPTSLKHTLESKQIEGLFFAGQVNGTSGYEEAAGQGLVAGINAALFVKQEAPLTLKRSDSYIGVMIDDLVTKGIDEPYRMFTSRAESRLNLREDNADLRLSEIAKTVGSLPSDKYQKFKLKEETLQNLSDKIKIKYLFPKKDDNILLSLGLPPLTDRLSFFELLKRPEVSFEKMKSIALFDSNVSRELENQLEISIKYSGYIDREKILFESVEKAYSLVIPKGFNFKSISGLSNEMIQRLESVSPTSIGQASKIKGLTPAAIATLVISLRNGTSRRVAQNS
jgi:tRNA uridine 5-carboxymethylaminomethyl modification enzyme